MENVDLKALNGTKTVCVAHVMITLAETPQDIYRGLPSQLIAESSLLQQDQLFPLYSEVLILEPRLLFALIFDF